MSTHVNSSKVPHLELDVLFVVAWQLAQEVTRWYISYRITNEIGELCLLRGFKVAFAFVIGYTLGLHEDLVNPRFAIPMENLKAR